MSTLVGTVATLLAVITPSEGAETGGGADWHPKWSYEPGMEGLLNLDYWTVLPIIVIIVTRLLMRIQRHLGEVWKPGDEGPIPLQTGEGRLPSTKSRSTVGRTQDRFGYSCSAAGECAAEAIFCCPTENSRHLEV